MVSAVRNVDACVALRRRGALLGQSALCGVLSLAVFGLIPGDASADPTGTKVIAGDVSIHKNGTHTEFRQKTPTAILNHDSFDIRANESVHFDQPSARALAVNRVIGKDLPTNIAGKLTATGNVWIINPSGVAISKGAHVNVNGLIATTADIANESILSGDHTFAGAPEGSAIINEGFITGGTGSIVLVAPTVENRGTITTTGSDIALGAGSGFTVDMDGDGLTRFEVSPGKDVSITTDGTIRAEGGAVYMSAESKDVVRGAIVSVGGKVEATRVEEKGGVIYIHSGNGKAEITGTVDASQSKGRGGKIIATGEFVEIKKTARLDASGATDGGTVHVGGGYRGKKIHSDVLRAAFAPADSPLPTARVAVVEGGAEIKVNAGAHGKGGEAVVWAEGATAFYGSIEARGGFLSGDGGLVEVSGKVNLAFDGDVDTSAAFGKPGALLLDPELVVIVAGAGGTGADDTELTADNLIDSQDPGGSPAGVTFTISAGAIQDALAVGGVTIEATGEIDFQTALDVSGAAGTGSLTLDAGTNIDFDQTVTMGAHPLVATAGGTITVNATLLSTTSVSLTAAGALLVNNDGVAGPTTISTGGGAVSLTSTGNGISILDGIVTGGGNVTLTATEIDFGNGANALIDAGTGSVTLAKSISTSPSDVNAVKLTSAGGGDSNAPGSTFDFAINQNELNKITAGSLIIDSNGRALLIESGASPVNVGRFGTVQLISDDASVTIEGLSTETVVGGPNTLTTTSFDVVAGTGDLLFENATPTFQNLTVTSANTVSQTNEVIVLGVTSINAAGAVTLDDASNDFGGVVNVDTSAGGDDAVVLTDTDSITLGAFAASSLTVTATDVEVDATFAATEVAVVNAAGDAVGIGAVADADAATFELTDTDLTRMAGANVTVTTSGGATGDVTVESATFSGNLTINASDDVDFGTTAHNFSGATLTVNAGGSGDAQITQGAGGSITAGAVVFSAETGISQADATAAIIAPDGTFIVSAGDVSLPGLNDFAATTFNASGVNITVNDISAISLGDIDATGNLTVTAGGAITDDGAGNAAGQDVNVAGTASLSATGAITLDDTGTDFADTAGAGEVDATGTAIALTDANAINLGTISGASLALNTSGNVTQTGGAQAVSVTGTTTINATGGAVTLTEATNDFNALTGTSASYDIAEANSINSAALTATAGDITITVPGSILVADTFTMRATGNVSLTSTAGGTVGAVLSAQIIADDNSSNAGDLTILTSGSAGGGPGSLLSGANVSVTGGNVVSSTLTATTGTLDVTASTGSFVASGQTTVQTVMTVDAVTGISLHNTNAAGMSLTTTNGTITQTPGSAVAVTGTTTLSAGGAGADVSLTGTGNDFDTVIATAADDDISLADTDEIVLGAVSAGTFALSAGGQIDDTPGASIVVAGSTTLTATGSNIVLDNDAGTGGEHDFDSDVTGDALVFSGADVTIRDVDKLTIGASTATGSLTVAAMDFDITGAVNVGGGTGTATFLSSRFVMDGFFSESATDGNGNGFVVQFSSADASLINSGSAIFREDSTIAAPTTTNVTSTARPINVFFFDSGASIGDITLETTTAGTDINFGSASFFGIQSTFRGNLTLIATDDVTNTASSAIGNQVSVVGTTSISADVVTLDQTLNDFGGTIAFSGTSATLVDTNSIVLGDVDATGNLTVVASGGTITDDGPGVAAGDDINVAGVTSLSAFDAIVLDDTFHDFNNGGVGTDPVNAAGTSITLNDITDIVLGDIDASGDLSVTAGGTITDDGDGAVAGTDINVAGATSLSASGAIVLDDLFNDFDAVVSGDAINATGTNVTINDRNAVVLGNVVASIDFAVSAGGAITQAAATSVTVGGTTSISAAGFDVTLDNATNDFADGAGAGELDVTGVNVTLRDVDAINLGTVSATSLTLNSGGAASQTGAGQAITVTGTTTINATGNSVTLTETSNDFGVLTGMSGSYEIAESNGLSLAGLDASSGDIIVTSGGSVFATTAAGVMATGNVRLESTGAGSVGAFSGSQIVANSDGSGGGDATLISNTGAVGGATNTTITGDNVVLNGDLLTTGIVIATAGSVTATADTSSITFNNSVSAATSIIGNAFTDITVSDLSAPNLVLATTNGDIGQFAGTTVAITGNSTLTARGTGQHIDLTEAGNDFSTVSASATGDSVSLTDVDDIILDQVDAANLTVTALNTITDAAGAVIAVSGTTSLTAANAGLTTFFDIVLDSSTNDFGTNVEAVGNSITLTDANSIVLGDIDAAGGLRVAALGGSITDDGSSAANGDIDVAGVTSLNASSDIILDDLFNDFDSDGAAGAPTDEVDAVASNLTLVDVDDISLGDIDVGGSATVTAAGAIVDDGAANSPDGVNIGGTAVLNAGGAVTLDDTANDFNIIDATATSMTLTDTNAIVLGDISVAGNMTVAANGNITDVGSGVAGQGVEVLGTTSLSTSGDIVLDDVVHDFGTDAGTGDATTDVDATAANVTLFDIDALQLGAVTASALTVTAGGSITDTVGDVISVSGTTILTARASSGTNLFDIRLDGNDATTADRPHDFSTVTFLGEDVWIVDSNTLTVLSGTARGDASADPTIGGASGSIRIDAGELTLTSLTAEGDITANSVGRFRIGALRSTGGDILLTTTGDNFSIIPGASRPTSSTGSAIPIWANGLLVLDAPSGSFATDGAASPPAGTQTRDNAIPEDLTFRSDTSLIEFDFNVGFSVIDTPGAPAGVYALTFDAPESAIRVGNGLFAIGSTEFLDEVDTASFNPFQSLARVNDTDLLFVSGAFGLISDGLFEVRLQNTSGVSGTQQGTGAIVTGVTYLGGQFDGLTLFGTFNGFSNVSAALKGFSPNASQMPIPASLGRGYPNLVVNSNNTANGCVIGAVTSCTPLISVVPFLSFEDGRLLGIAFVDPDDDEDDPFSNRGDEEEWE